MKKVLLIGGIFPFDSMDQIIKNSKGNVDFAAHNFQMKIIKGLEDNNVDFDVISLPFISSYPKYYNKINVPASKKDNFQFLKYTNLPYYKIFSRYCSLKKALRKYCKHNKDINIIIYSLHLPFIMNAKFIKKLCPSANINLIVPDLLEHMSNSRRKLFKLFKKVEIKKTNENLKYIDSFVFLTEPMNDRLNKYKKPYTVIEGISNLESKELPKIELANEKFITYTGTLAKRYGVMNLVEAFLKIKDQESKLIICGLGDRAEEIKKIASENERVIYKGLVTPEEAKLIQSKSHILINPRLNNEEYTKYSFPSKIMEYVSTGKPVICYKLDGFPNEYDEVLQYPKDDTVQELANCIDKVLQYDAEKLNDLKEKSLLLMGEKSSKNSVKKIIDLFE